ncbi:UNVERIFIED_CONTAM: Receptor-like cytosolic serine/threonine-protein kinase RBK1 [Sesamum radiatum]|uniref:Receptor-like cytosolic serine/threonine-protein kinase RBK1 n=1 Tax=Sesamum radiatum TaxID=300843 RepID=A0AAW2V7J9_SESRA
MRMAADDTGVAECSGGESTAAAGTVGDDGGAVVVVGMKMDSRSRELLTWALVKVAQSGDRVVALHILDPNADKSTLLALVKTFDSVLAAYEGFCNLKEVDLKLKVCKGSPIRVYHKIRSRISVAKYCAKNLQKNVSVMCVDNGKIVFQRDSNASKVSLFGSLDESGSRMKRRKTLPKSPLSLPPERVLSSSSNGSEDTSMALVPLRTQELPEPKSGWAVLRRVFLHKRRKQITAPDRDDCHLDLDPENGAIVLYSAETNSTYSSSIFMEELKALGEKYSTTCQLFSYQDLLSATNSFLPGSQKSENLFGWEERYKVALGVVEALDHLHNTAESIIHRDVKSSNILLSDDFEPQLSDFGLATWASSCSHHMSASDVAGTFGYLAPEYFMHGKLNEKIDVYAFGVVLLELLSGRKPIDNGFPNGQESLVMWAKHILKEGKISELQDPKLVNACNWDQFEKMVLAATLCIRLEPQSRPETSLVLKLLRGDPEVLEWARQETETSEDLFNVINGEQSATNIQSFINLALLNLDDDSASSSSTEQNLSVEDYLGGRWSRSSSFD